MGLIVDIEKEVGGFFLKANFETNGAPLGFLGASGSGKSMTLRCIAGLETPTKGKIILNGRTLFDTEKKINIPCQQRKIGFLFQNYALFPHMTVEENIGIGVKGISSQQKRVLVQERIKSMQLEGLEKRYPSELSGGQQQRVALARALAIEPEVLLLDEPFSALDNHLRSQMEEEMLGILAGYEGVSLFVTHNINEAYRICEDIAIFSQGSITAWGEKDKMFQQPPTYAAAQLTGCKNLSKARKQGEYTILAEEWGCLLEVEQPVPDHIRYVGIRAHDIQFCKEAPSQNSYKGQITHVSTTPFHVSIFFKIEKNGDKPLQIKLTKQQWEEERQDLSSYIVSLDKSKLFVMTK